MLKDFPDTVLGWHPTGSNYICNPPVTDTDIDTVIHVKSLAKAEVFLLQDGWQPCDDTEYEPGQFRAYRRDNENYIVTESIGYFNRYVMATEAAKALNLLNKEDRIKLFIEILNHDDHSWLNGPLKYNTDIRGVLWEPTASGTSTSTEA